MRKALLMGTAGLALIGGLAVPASAADTTTTFELTAGSTGLSLSAPTNASLGTVALGANPSANLGNVTVDDQRGTLLGSWTATVTSDDFITGVRTAGSINLAERTIAKSNATYNPGLLTSAVSTGTAVRLAGVSGTLAASRTAYSATGALGVNTTTWAPTVSIAVPAAAVVGVYSGTITHSVA